MDDSEPLNQNPQPLIPLQNLLVIRDDYFVHHESPVFPPTHHEDLPVPPPLPPPDPESSDESESSDSSSPATSEPPVVSDLRWRVVGEGIARFCEILKAKVVSGFGSYAASLRSVLPVTAMAALLVVSLSLVFLKMKMRLPWRRRSVAVRKDNEERLLLLVKDNDEKIKQLLLQIAQMNEALSAPRRVHVLRIK